MNDKHEKALEEIQRKIAGIPEDVLDAFQKGLERHSFSARLDAHHAIRNTILRRIEIESCTQTDILVITGRDNVDGAGRMILPIKFCGVDTDFRPLVIIREPNFVATPHGSTPSFITTTSRSTIRQPSNGEFLVDRAGNVLNNRDFLVDVSVEVMAWRGNESPAGGIEFSWVCTVEAVRLGNIGG